MWQITMAYGKEWVLESGSSMEFFGGIQKSE
jgi:hypothetical protein